MRARLINLSGLFVHFTHHTSARLSPPGRRALLKLSAMTPSVRPSHRNNLRAQFDPRALRCPECPCRSVPCLRSSSWCCLRHGHRMRRRPAVAKDHSPSGCCVTLTHALRLRTTRRIIFNWAGITSSPRTARRRLGDERRLGRRQEPPFLRGRIRNCGTST